MDSICILTLHLGTIMGQARLYKTYIKNDGSYADMDTIYINEEDIEKYLNRSLKTCEDLSGTMYIVAYTQEALYFSSYYQKNIVYFISNANKINTLTEFKECLKKYHPEYVNKLDLNIVIEELNNMATMVLDDEYLYPNMKRIIQHKVK